MTARRREVPPAGAWSDAADKQNQAKQNAAEIVTAPATWSDVERLFGTRGEPSRCWCRWFTLPGAAWKETDPVQRRQLLRERFDAGLPEPGVLAYREDEPVGWCAVEPRHSYPRIIASQLLRKSGLNATDDTTTVAEEAIWAVSCFVVAPGHRRTGVAAALLDAAVAHAFNHGAAIVEGYPVDAAQRPAAGSSDLYHGTVGLFRAAGFTVAATPAPGRAVMRLNRAT